MAAMNPLEEAASSQNNFNETQSLIQKKLISVLARHMGTFLDNAELAQFCQTAHFSHAACQVDVAERKKVSEELLPHVFNANPHEVEAFFAKPDAKISMILTKTSYREGYDSKKLKQFVCFRHWRAVSPLQAAALCGDNFLVLKLLAPIINDDKLRLEAIKQLEEVRNRKVKAVQENSSAAASPAAAAAASAASASAAGSTSDSNGREEKNSAESAQIEYADFAEYLAPVQSLIKAYKDYFTQGSILSRQGKWHTLDKQWGIVGECHKRLPRYILQEFCSDKPFDPTPEFNSEPSRGNCCYFDATLLDLDDLGVGTLHGLFKGKQVAGITWRGGARQAGPWGGKATTYGPWARKDSVAINKLFELRQAELGNIINMLQNPATALTLVSDDKDVDMKP